MFGIHAITKSDGHVHPLKGPTWCPIYTGNIRTLETTTLLPVNVKTAKQFVIANVAVNALC